MKPLSNVEHFDEETLAQALEEFKKRYPHIVAWWREVCLIDHPTAEEIRAGLVVREKERGQHDAK